MSDNLTIYLKELQIQLHNLTKKLQNMEQQLIEQNLNSQNQRLEAVEKLQIDNDHWQPNEFKLIYQEDIAQKVDKNLINSILAQMFKL